MRTFIWRKLLGRKGETVLEEEVSVTGVLVLEVRA